MKTYLLKILLFLSVIAVADRLFGAAFQYLHDHADGGMTRQMRYACRESDEDCLVFGSSRALHDYVPEILADSLGMTCLNVGSGGMGIIYNLGLLKMVTARYSPKLIIYDVYHFDFYRNESPMKFLAPLRPYYDEPGIDSLFWAVDPDSRYKMQSGFYRFNSSFFRVLLNYFQSNPVNSGYIPYTESMKEVPTPKNLLFSTPETDSLKIRCFEEFIRLTQEKGIRLVCSVAPTFQQTRDENMFVPIEDLCREYGIPFLETDYPEIYEHKAYFWDRVHMCDKGARTYTSRIANEIKETTTLPI